MPNSFSFAQIERFKREAKQLRHNTPITHSQALDRIAEANGYDNWSLLMKHSDLSLVSQEPPVQEVITVARAPFEFTRTHDEIRQALRKVPEPSYGRSSAIDEARWLTEDICHEFTSAENAVDFAVDYMTSLLTVPRFRINLASKANWEMRCWLPYCVHPTNDEGRFRHTRSS